MIDQLFAAFLLDSLKSAAPFTQDAQAMRELASAAHRSTALKARRPSAAVQAFAQHAAADQALWTGTAPAKPVTAYELALAHALRPGALQFRRAAQLQHAAAAVLRRAGTPVPEVHIAVATTLPAQGPRIVTVRRALLGGARTISNGTLHDQSWLGALRNLFSV